MEAETKRIQTKLNYLTTHIGDYGSQYRAIIMEEINFLTCQLELLDKMAKAELLNESVTL